LVSTFVDPSRRSPVIDRFPNEVCVWLVSDFPESRADNFPATFVVPTAKLPAATMFVRVVPDGMYGDACCPEIDHPTVPLVVRLVT
jgi:hypothetical protein